MRIHQSHAECRVDRHRNVYWADKTDAVADAGADADADADANAYVREMEYHRLVCRIFGVNPRS